MSLIPTACGINAVYEPPETERVIVEELNVTENGTYTAPDGVAYSPVVVAISGGGGGGASALQSGVNFIDYDGSLVQHYTADEFVSLTALPENPSHTGLTSQGWNWSLADAQAYVEEYGSLNIGQMYITESGDTEIDIELHEGRLSPTLGLGINGTVTVDWGDGSAAETMTGSSLTTVVNQQHVYADEGSYTIKITPTSGSFAIIGNSSYGSYLLWKNSTSSGLNRTYQNVIQAVRLGNNVSIGSYAFRNCYSLASVTIPDSVTSIESYAFNYCYSLASVTIPDSVTSIGSYAFNYCYSLASVTMPDSVTSIGESAFEYCNSLANITIPDGVTNIGVGVFGNCYSLASVTIPNSVTNIGKYAFHGCNSLVSVTILDSVTSIENSAFQNCYSLVSVTILDNVTSIGNYAFGDCNGLGIMEFFPTTPPTVSNSNAFNGIPTDCVIYVPTGTLSTYQNATNYSGIASQMVEW